MLNRAGTKLLRRLLSSNRLCYHWYDGLTSVIEKIFGPGAWPEERLQRVGHTFHLLHLTVLHTTEMKNLAISWADLWSDKVTFIPYKSTGTSLRNFRYSNTQENELQQCTHSLYNMDIHGFYTHHAVRVANWSGLRFEFTSEKLSQVSVVL